MSHRFPQPNDEYPIIFREVTDAELPTSVMTERGARYGDFENVAKGGTCIIESCIDRRLGRVVCRKRLRPEFENDRVEQVRFLREARVTAMLQHPNTLPIYDVDQDEDGKYFFTMKFVRGVTLRDVIDRLRAKEADVEEKWSLRRLINVAAQTGLALAFAHAHGVIHRDIKPSNILVGPFGEVLLLDWGLAKVWNQSGTDDPLDVFVPQAPPTQTTKKLRDRTLTDLGHLRATPLYMSPEQIQDASNVDHRTDIYSFGAVLYELLTLEDMAWGDTMYELIDHIQNDMPETPSNKAPSRDIPELLESLCMRSVAKAPEDRIQSMEEITEALREWSDLP